LPRANAITFRMREVNATKAEHTRSTILSFIVISESPIACDLPWIPPFSGRYQMMFIMNLGATGERASTQWGCVRSRYATEPPPRGVLLAARLVRAGAVPADAAKQRRLRGAELRAGAVPCVRAGEYDQAGDLHSSRGGSAGAGRVAGCRIV